MWVPAAIPKADIQQHYTQHSKGRGCIQTPSSTGTNKGIHICQPDQSQIAGSSGCLGNWSRDTTQTLRAKVFEEPLFFK